MPKSSTERQAEFRNRVRRGEIHRVQVYLQPSVYQALGALTGGKHGNTHTEVISTLIMQAHKNVVRIETAKQKSATVPAKRAEITKDITSKPVMTMQAITTRKRHGNVYDVLHQGQSIAVVSKGSDNSWQASTAGDKPYFTGDTRRKAVAKWLDHYLRQ